MRYPEYVRKFIEDNYQAMDNRELSIALAAAGYKYTQMQIKYYKKNHHLTGGKAMQIYSKIVSEDMGQYIREIVEGKRPEEIAEAVNAKFGTGIKKEQVVSYMKNHKIRNNRNTRFKAGQPCQNRLAKGEYYPGCEKHWFKKGSVPHTTLPVGTEIIRSDGYHWVKIGEPKVWKFKHLLVWEAAHGPVEEGCCIIFKDQNKDNCSLDNLMMIKRSELSAANQKKYLTHVPELTEAGIQIIRIKKKVKEKRKHETGIKRTDTVQKCESGTEG